MLNLSISLEEFKTIISNELLDYKKNVSKKGGSSPIFLSEDIDNLLITKDHLNFLLNAFLTKKINEWELNYLAEGILLSDKTSFDSSKTNDALLALTDSELFKSINEKYIQRILEELSV